jgi:predicted AAA+ superfamily ATPase
MVFRQTAIRFFEILKETLIIHRTMPISTYRTEHGAEVDFIVEPNNVPWAIECKGSHQVGRGDLRGLASFAETIKGKHRAVVAYLGSVPRFTGGGSEIPCRWLRNHSRPANQGQARFARRLWRPLICRACP